MRRWLFAAAAVLLVFSVTACSLPFSLDDLSGETEPSSEERTYVITTENHSGLQLMADCIHWSDNSLCAIAYLGSAGTYQKKLASLHSSRFSDVDQESFDSMRQVKVGGNEVYLVVPRFDLEDLSVFEVGFDSEGESHVLRQVADMDEPFLLFCTAEGTPNAQLSASLKSLNKHFKYIPLRRSGSEALADFAVGFQPVER